VFCRCLAILIGLLVSSTSSCLRAQAFAKKRTSPYCRQIGSLRYPLGSNKIMRNVPRKVSCENRSNYWR
jgi:hypothetical protein